MTDETAQTLPQAEAAPDEAAPRRRLPWKFLVALGITLTIALVLAWPVGYYSSSAQLMVSIAGAAVGGGLLFVGMIARLLRKRAGRRYLAAGCVIAVLALVYPLHKAVLHYEMQRAQAYCEALCPWLEEHIKTHGSSPSTIDHLAPRPRPRLVDDSFYVRVGAQYAFIIGYPDSIGPEGYYYQSKLKRWEVFN